jgi:hypothetical protein
VPAFQFDLTSTQSSIVALAAAGTALLALLIAVSARLRLRRMSKGLRVLSGRSDEGDLLQLASRQAGEVERLLRRMAEQQEELAQIRADLAAALRHVSVVRFDAFGDGAGRMSFSAALLDDSGDGMLLTSINGRGETRTYGKAVVGGRSEATLTPEEEQAVAAAR